MSFDGTAGETRFEDEIRLNKVGDWMCIVELVFEDIYTGTPSKAVTQVQKKLL